MKRSGRRGRLLVVHHFFHPDDVVAARLFRDLAEAQRDRGWDVTVLTSNRAWGEPRRALAPRETWQGIDVIRAYRPPLDQRRPLARLANSAWLLGAWLAHARAMAPFDAVVLGSDPAFAPLVLPGLRRLWPEAALVHWCFDLYPEAVEADGVGRGLATLAVPWAKHAMGEAYRVCDAVVDLGPRMRERLRAYAFDGRRVTLVPWASHECPAEAPDPRARRELFGDAKIGLLYSGTMGRAHDYEPLLELARRARRASGDDVVFTFACRGSRMADLRARVTARDTNVRVLDYFPEDGLAARLGSADIHLLGLRPEWSGLVVPSRFFGSLALGKPTIYAGPRDSDVATWIGKLGVGLVADEGSLDAIVRTLDGCRRDRGPLSEWASRARRAYAAHFSRAHANDAFDSLLRQLTAVRRGTVPARPPAESLAP